ATLALDTAWDPAMTITVDRGAARTLDHKQELQVPPGKHLLIFELLSDNASVRKESPLTVKPGERVHVDNPIARPAFVTVPEAISTPQGMTLVDGESWGPSPATHRPLQPGAHTIEIRATRPEVSSRTFKQSITVESGGGLTVTFNLLRDDPPLVYPT